MALAITKLSSAAPIQFTGGEQPVSTYLLVTAKKADQKASDHWAGFKSIRDQIRIDPTLSAVILVVTGYLVATRGFLYGLLACLGMSVVANCVSDSSRYVEIKRDQLNSI